MSYVLRILGSSNSVTGSFQISFDNNKIAIEVSIQVVEEYDMIESILAIDGEYS